ncbi:hypothetical protein AYI68_g499 [Smittium mucronatum]|uniref:Uncharacterized protein n=1 Tax=Smittium mucronatum TaxID=133383 RepID=A0A1R0H807_9FUNG|nr:hypothetical protein AYI68_g499 [Smittium mucronatum]
MYTSAYLFHGFQKLEMVRITRNTTTTPRNICIVLPFSGSWKPSEASIRINWGEVGGHQLYHETPFFSLVVAMEKVFFDIFKQPKLLIFPHFGNIGELHINGYWRSQNRFVYIPPKPDQIFFPREICAHLFSTKLDYLLVFDCPNLYSLIAGSCIQESKHNGSGCTIVDPVFFFFFSKPRWSPRPPSTPSSFGYSMRHCNKPDRI